MNDFKRPGGYGDDLAFSELLLKGEGTPLTIFEVDRLVRAFVMGTLQHPERTVGEAERLQRILYGQEPGYACTSWNSPHGLGQWLAERMQIADGNRAVVWTLLGLVHRLGELDTDGGDGWKAEVDTALAEAMDRLTGGAWAYWQYVRQPEEPEAT